MKGFRGFVITLGVMFAMMTFFPGISAFAYGSHDNPQTTAEQVSNRDTTKSFVLHAKQHIDADCCKKPKRTFDSLQGHESGRNLETRFRLPDCLAS